MLNLSRDYRRHQFIALTLALVLAGCAQPSTVAIKTPIAAPPSDAMRQPLPAPILPGGPMRGSEFASRYVGLQIQYIRETRRFSRLQAYVRRVRGN